MAKQDKWGEQTHRREEVDGGTQREEVGRRDKGQEAIEPVAARGRQPEPLPNAHVSVNTR